MVQTHDVQTNSDSMQNVQKSTNNLLMCSAVQRTYPDKARPLSVTTVNG